MRWAVSPAAAASLDAKRQFYDFAAQRGASFIDHVAVTNYSEVAVKFHVYAADAMTDSNTSQFTLISPKKRSADLGSWVSIQGGPSTCPASAEGKALSDCLAKLGTEVTVQPNTAVIVPFTITVPKNARAGDHAAGIVASYTEPGTGKTAVAVEQRVGSRVYLRVDGKLAPQLTASGAVLNFHGGKNPFGGGSASIAFDLTDSGNTRVSGLPHLAVTGPFGIPVAKVTTSIVQNLLPGGVAHVQAEIPKGVPRLLLLFGGITVQAQAADGTIKGDKLPADAHATAIGWAVPWVWLLIAFVVAVVVVGGLWWRRRSRERLAAALHEYAQYMRSQAAEAGELVTHAGEQESSR